MRVSWFAAQGVVLALLTACGGGGGGGGGDGASGSGESSESLTYSGNRNAAALSTTNASALVASVLSDEPLAGGIFTSSIAPAGPQAGSGALRAARRLARGMRAVPRQRAASSLTAALVDETTPCESGSVRAQGDIGSSGTGSLTISYNQCRQGGMTLNGVATMKIDAYDPVTDRPTDFTMSFGRLAIREAGEDSVVSGSMRQQIDLAAHTVTTTANVVVRDNLTGAMLMTEGLVLLDTYGSFNLFGPFTETISGRIYHSVHGYVEITTEAALFFASDSAEFPDTGRIVLRGSGGRSVRARALSAQLARLDLDLDGDGAYELSPMLKWSDLSGPSGANLADSDGDGMHDSWETANGLDANSSADANQDRDGDGASNKTEYLAGTDSNDGVSTPPAAGLTLQMTGPNSTIAVGTQVTYNLTLMNSSGAQATGVVVTDTLPAGAVFVSASTTRGNCSGTGPVLCNVGTVAAFETLSLSVTVTASAPGVITNTATVTSGTPDPDLSNNTATRTAVVGATSGGLQARIDAAAPGATIIVEPGIYVGRLDFLNKNVTLQSRDGPATTILNGGGDTAVRIGPGGALKGFTIAGGIESIGSAVEVRGDGSVISGNVFEGNIQAVGYFGAAIGGNSASPTIEGNIFRNQTCDDQLLSGVVAIINTAVPRIVNNLFLNNQCRGINLTLASGPAGSQALVLNNTFIGNNVAILLDRDGTAVQQHFYRNNLIVDNQIGVDRAAGSPVPGLVWENNLVFGNTTNYRNVPDQTGTNGNISADPLFVDAAAGNYRLNPGSPAIDAGGGTGAPTADFDGAPRPRDGDGIGSALVDIGAFERQ
jgi:uncharacterized repeat protein (TIGR01451 family)